MVGDPGIELMVLRWFPKWPKSVGKYLSIALYSGKRFAIYDSVLGQSQARLHRRCREFESLTTHHKLP